MHRIIRIIVYANSPKEARENAETILDEDLVETKVYDYGTFFDDDSSSMSGKARWGNHIPSVVLADSKKGKKLINEGMKYTKESFFENIGRIKEAIKEYSVEELFEGEVVDIKKKILEG